MSSSLMRMSRVDSVDDAFMDEDENGNQRWMVYLKKGWAFDDAARSREDDPDGSIACHCSGGTVRELQRRIREAEPCHCGRCASA